MRPVWCCVCAFALALGSTTALAGVPDPIVILHPAGPIPVTVLRPDGTPDPGHPSPVSGKYTGPTERTVTVRDLVGAPAPGVLVRISFAACCDIELCSVTGQPGVSVDLENHTIEGVTNEAGQIAFTVIGAAQNVENGTPPIQDGCGGASDAKYVEVLVNYSPDFIVRLRTSAFVFNQDGGAVGGGGAVTAQDAGRVLQDMFAYYFDTQLRGRSDLNGDGMISGSDAGLLLHESLRLGNAGAQTLYACPGGTLADRPPTCP